MSDRDIKSWNDRLADQVARKWENYHKQRIDLSVARSAQPVEIVGEYIYVENVSADSVSATIQLNRNTNPELALVKRRSIETIFERLFITNAAQANAWIDIVTGINFKIADIFFLIDVGESVALQPNTVYQAATDGYVTATGAGNELDPLWMTMKTSPDNIIWTDRVNATDNYFAFDMHVDYIVKKNEYFQIFLYQPLHFAYMFWRSLRIA
jgi:hypothetical protein